MEREEIESLLSGFKTEILGEVDRRNQGLASTISKDVKKALEAISKPESDTNDESNTRITTKALQQELEALKEQLAEKDASEFNSARSSALAQVVGSKNLTNPSTVQKLLELQYGSALKREGNKWFLESDDGKVTTLENLLDSYLQTDEGKMFLPPTGVLGSGSKETNKNVPVTNKPSNPFLGVVEKMVS